MASLEDEVLRHQFIYVPWVEDKPVYQHSPQLALYLQKKHRARLTAVCNMKSNIPDVLKKTPAVTERSGSVIDGGVVFAYCPTYKLMSKVTHLEKSIITDRSNRRSRHAITDISCLLPGTAPSP